MRLAANPPEEIAFREAQLKEIDARIARVSRECCEDIARGAPVTWIDAHIALLKGLYNSREMIIVELQRAGGYVTDAYERRRNNGGERGRNVDRGIQETARHDAGGAGAAGGRFAGADRHT